MERACPFTTVKDHLRRTPDEVDYHDAVYDHQILLNNTVRPADVAAHAAAHCEGSDWAAATTSETGTVEACKFVTETWEEYSERAPFREAALVQYFAEQEAEAVAENKRAERRKEVSDRAVAAVVGAEMAYREKHLRPKLHSLQIDFGQREAVKMLAERDGVEAKEGTWRADGATVEERLGRKGIETAFADGMRDVLDTLAKQHEAMLVEQERREQERRAREEAARLEEERKRKEAEAVERHRREQEEDAKRIERKRREDERKAKAKAERELRQKQMRGGSGEAS